MIAIIRSGRRKHKMLLPFFALDHLYGKKIMIDAIVFRL